MAAQIILYAFAALFIIAVIGIILLPIVESILDKLSLVEFSSTGNTWVASLHDKFQSIMQYFPLVAGGAVFLMILLCAIKRVIWGGSGEVEYDYEA